MKRFLFTLLVCASLGVQAQTRWCIVDASQPEKPVAAMSAVAFLLNSDWTDLVSVVCKDGTLHGPMASVAFRQLDPSGIDTPVVPQGEFSLLADPIGATLTLSGCAAGQPVAVFDLGGSRLLQLVTSQDRTVLSVAHLPAGVYLLRVGHTTIKFRKR